MREKKRRSRSQVPCIVFCSHYRNGQFNLLFEMMVHQYGCCWFSLCCCCCCYSAAHVSLYRFQSDFSLQKIVDERAHHKRVNNGYEVHVFSQFDLLLPFVFEVCVCAPFCIFFFLFFRSKNQSPDPHSHFNSSSLTKAKQN